jgi:hypothetical protein
MVGFTTTEEAIVPPGFQVYDNAPEAVKVALCPGQIDVGELTAVMVGLLPTGITTVVVPTQPPEDPSTV